MATVASQAVTVAACGIIVGAAVGVTLGSALWRTTADDVGVVSNVTIPLLVLAAVAAATVALVSLVGVIPARHAANVPVAPALRAE